MTTRNPNTRALISALKSDLEPMREAALQVLEGIIEGTSDRERMGALMVELDCSTTTATSLLRLYRKAQQ